MLMQRKRYIDVLRSVAILCMIEVHTSAQLAPTNISDDSLIVLIVASIGGLAAPLFITLSGWGVQHSLFQKTINLTAKNSLLYWAISRCLFLLFCQLIVNLIANHVFNWYSPGVLSLLAICTILSIPLSKTKLKIRVFLFILMFLTPLVNSYYFEINGSWDFLITSNSPYEWFERILFNGTYPLFPWAAFFLLGGILREGNDSLNNKMIGFGVFISSSFILYSIITNRQWALTQGDALLTFFPASVAFIITASTTVLLLFLVLKKYEGTLQKIKLVEQFSKIGKLSLTIYLLHFIPLRILEELALNNWSLLQAGIITLIFTFIWIPLSLIHDKWMKKYSFESLLRYILAKKDIPSIYVSEP